ncbi:MAG: DUF4870 domain-containing protein [Opitutaceae bacterium]|jgi:hypothetical protein
MDTSLSPSPVSGNDRLWSVLCHLSGFLGVPFLLPLVVYLAMKQDSAFVAAHSREALNFHISILIYCLVIIPLCFIGVGFLLGGALIILYTILSIVAAIKTSENLLYRYPITIRLV